MATYSKKPGLKNGSKKMPRPYWFAFMDACLLLAGNNLQPMAGCLHFITISGWISVNNCKICCGTVVISFALIPL